MNNNTSDNNRNYNYLPCRYSTLYYNDSFSFKLNAIIVAIVNIIVAIPTIGLNFLVCVAFIKKASLRRNGNKVLFSLSVSDLLSGLLVQPLISCMLLIFYALEPLDIPCTIVHFTSTCGHTLACVSLLTVSFISLERYLAIFYPFVYSRRISATFLFMACGFLWGISCVIVLSTVYLKLYVAFFWTNAVVIGFSYLWNIFVYIKIMRQIKKVHKETSKLQKRFGAGEKTNKESKSKGTQVVGAIIISLLVTYAPQVILNLWRTSAKHPKFIDLYLEYWSMTFGLLNPCLNPIFYCYYNTEIRREVYSLLCFKLRKVNKTNGINNSAYNHENTTSMVELKRNSLSSMTRYDTTSIK